MTGRSNAVHKADVKIGSTYAVKVSGRVVPVTILEANKQMVGYPQRREVVMWVGENRQTRKHVSIRTAAKLRYELVWSGPVDLNTKQGGRWVRKDSPIVFELDCDLPDDLHVFEANKLREQVTFRIPHTYLSDDQQRVLRDFTRDELHSLCGEDAPEQCQEFEDESGRWRRV